MRSLFHAQVTNQLLDVLYPAGGREAGSGTNSGRPLLASLRALHLGRTRAGAGAPLHRLTALLTLTFCDQSLTDAGLQVRHLALGHSEVWRLTLFRLMCSTNNRQLQLAPACSITPLAAQAGSSSEGC